MACKLEYRISLCMYSLVCAYAYLDISTCMCVSGELAMTQMNKMKFLFHKILKFNIEDRHANS